MAPDAISLLAVSVDVKARGSLVFLFDASVIGILLETPLASGGQNLDLDAFETALPEMSTFEGLGGLPEAEVHLLERTVVEGLPEAEVCLPERPVVEDLPEAEMFLPDRLVEGLRCILELDGSLLETSTFETLGSLPETDSRVCEGPTLEIPGAFPELATCLDFETKVDLMLPFSSLFLCGPSGMDDDLVVALVFFTSTPNLLGICLSAS